MDRQAALRELDDALSDVETLLKNHDVAAALSDDGINISLAITALDGLRAYLKGNKPQAIEDLATAAEEIAARAAIPE
jgi:hypothetical protein